MVRSAPSQSLRLPNLSQIKAASAAINNGEKKMATYSVSPEVAVNIAVGRTVVSSALLTADDKKLISRLSAQLSINPSEIIAVSYARLNIEMFSSDFVSTRK